DKVDAEDLKPFGRALLPLSLTRSANYEWLYATACLSPTIAGKVDRLEGVIRDGQGKPRKTSAGTRRTRPGSEFVLGGGSWELFDLPPGHYSLELRALDKDKKVITARTVDLLHGKAPVREAQNPSPMVENTRAHPRPKAEQPKGRREKLSVG